MRPRLPFRTLLAQFTLRVIAPLTLVMLVMIAVGLLAYQQAVTSLLIDRDRQLAVLSTAYLSDALTGYTRELGSLAASPDLRSASPGRRMAALENGSRLLQIFAAGIVLVDAQGRVLTVMPEGGSPVGETVAGQAYFQSARQRLAPAFSDVVVDARTGQSIFVIAAPLTDEAGRFSGALLGAVDLANTTLSEPLSKLRLGDAGYAYLIDGRGRVLFHPDAANIGADFADRPYVQNVVAGESGGTLWRARTGEEVVLGYAPVANTAWGLIVREPWDTIVGPAQAYGVLMALATVMAVAVAACLLILGVRRVALPVRALVEQTGRLAAGESVEPVAASGIVEIDTLERAFNQMAVQIAAYRAGLRRYVEAITHSQEEERRRIARELHDETIQNLIWVNRRLELFQASEGDPARRAQLADLQQLMADSVQGVRQISRDLRPLILEDLGLIPALQTLIQAAHQGQGAIPQATLEVRGQVEALSPKQELVLYRVTQEALANVRRHAHATGVCVELAFEPGRVRLNVADDGQGFEMPRTLTELAQHDSFGLMGIQERVWALGGSLNLQAAPGHGTCIEVAVPREPVNQRDQQSLSSEMPGDPEP